jgi:hypothetical protein
MSNTARSADATRIKHRTGPEPSISVLARALVNALGDVVLDLGAAKTLADVREALGVDGSTGSLFAVKTVGQAVASSVTLVDDLQLVLPVSANSTYLFELGLVLTEDGGGIDADVTIPAGATLYGNWFTMYGDEPTPSANPITTKTTIAQEFAGDTYMAVQKFVVVTSSTAGNVQYKFAQLTSNAAASSTLAGSWIKAEKVTNLNE